MPALLQDPGSHSDSVQHLPVDVDDVPSAQEYEDELPEAYCGGCGRLIDEESVEEGVIQFATKLWHVECFRCAKCKNRVSTERDDILLLSDGHPICGECNYSCNICHLPIMEEAIMTGDESYHAACFTCRSCNSKIEELVFAKTSQGIYCMKCHNDRVARSRKHAEQKRAKARREKQLREAEAARAKEGNDSENPSVSASTTDEQLELMKQSRSNDSPPSLPTKDQSLSSSSPPASTSNAPTAASSSAMLSPWPTNSGSSTPRPGSSNGKRPLNPPPPPTSTREVRPSASNPHISAHDSRNAIDSQTSQSSLASSTLVDDVSNSRLDLGEVTPLSPRKKTAGLPTVSGNASPVSPRPKLPDVERASSPAMPPSPRKPVSLVSASHFSSSPDNSHDKELKRTQNSVQRYDATSTLAAPSSLTMNAAKKPLSASASSSRMSKAYSFYDPDFLSLMDSFGHSDSNDDLNNQPPPLPQLKSSASPSPSKGDSTGQDLSAVEADGGDGTVESEKEVLSEERRDSTGSLRTLSSKMRASMQQARDGQVSMEIDFIETVLRDLEDTRQRMETLQTKYDRIRRASQQAAQGFSMAKEEYEHEVNARHEAELEMARLKRQLAEQALKLATINSEKRQKEQLERRSQNVKATLQGMERDLAKLTVERDLTVAEVAELVAMQDGSTVSSSSDADSAITKSLTSRLEAVKGRYRKEIDDLTLERDALLIEIEELKQSKDLFLEEAQSLNAKNEELNTLLSQLNRKVEVATLQSRDQLPPLPRTNKDLPLQQTTNRNASGFGFGSRNKQIQKHNIGSPSISSHDNPPNSAGLDSASLDTAVQQIVKPEKIEPAPMVKKFKWMKPKLSETSKANILSSGQASNVPPVPPKGANGASNAGSGMTRATSHDIVVREHLFQPFNVLRPTRCLACQKSMWGQSEMRCALCAQVCHSRCLQNLPLSCNQPYTRPDETQTESVGPSMFGKELTEQASQESRDVPLIVDECIQAVEAFGMDYEGIYRKSGGTSQLKVITQLFERGGAFDLEDTERFNDVSAITSVLKNYFRELPTPLLTFDLYDDFIRIVEAKSEGGIKGEQMKELVSRLPRQHFCTLKTLILHLHRVQERSGDNRMNARNLGVVFGPTLMRSGDPSQEFAHMGGKAMTIEYFIDHAQELFT